MSNWPKMTSSSAQDICITVDELLEGYALGALESDEMLLVADWIHDCPAQVERLQRLDETVGMIGLAPSPVSTPDALWIRLQASTMDSASKITPPIELGSRKSSVVMLPRWAAGLAAALVLLLVATAISLGAALRDNVEPDDTFEATVAYYMTSGATVIPLSSNSIPEYESWQGKGALVVMPDMPPLLVVDNCEPASNGWSYVVWVAANGQRTGMGLLTIGEDGRGLMTLENMGSLDSYDSIGVSMKSDDDRVYDLIEGPPRQEG